MVTALMVKEIDPSASDERAQGYADGWNDRELLINPVTDEKVDPDSAKWHDVYYNKK